MAWQLIKMCSLALMVCVVAYMSYFEGQRSMTRELLETDRQVAVAIFRVEEVQKHLRECYLYANHYKESAIAANRMMAYKDPQWEDTPAALGGSEH